MSAIASSVLEYCSTYVIWGMVITQVQTTLLIQHLDMALRLHIKIQNVQCEPSRPN